LHSGLFTQSRFAPSKPRSGFSTQPLNSTPMSTAPLLPPENNFADLREVADKLLKSTTDGDLNRLIELVGRLAYRSDLLEREVERLGRAK
jgi:hypothetical protein